MNKEVKKKWLEMLKTAKKATGTFQRGNSDARCCLGHLCELYRLETGRGSWSNNGRLFVISPEDYGSCATLPAAVARWAKLSQRQHDLAILNDHNEGFPISEIEKL